MNEPALVDVRIEIEGTPLADDDADDNPGIPPLLPGLLAGLRDDAPIILYAPLFAVRKVRRRPKND